MSGRDPRISVIIPAYHSDSTIAACLEALRAQSFHDFETIVVNSSPEERTRQIVSNGFPEIVFKQSTQRLFPHAARNLGVSLASGEILVFTDPDCIPKPNWLAELVRAVDQGHPVVQGSVDSVGTSWRERGIHFCKRFSLLSALTAYSPWIVSSINACYTRQAWDAAGPFDSELFCADALLGWRARALGYPATFEPRALVADAHTESSAELFRQRYVRGKEFAGVRATYEHWSRARAAGYALALPIMLAMILSQAFRNAFAARQSITFILTLPIQFVGHLGWLLGESQEYLLRAISTPQAMPGIQIEQVALRKNAGAQHSDS